MVQFLSNKFIDLNKYADGNTVLEMAQNSPLSVISRLLFVKTLNRMSS